MKSIMKLALLERFPARASPGGKPPSNRIQTRPPRHTLPTLKAPRSKQSVSNTPAPLSNLLAELSRQQLSSILPHVVAGWRQNRHANQVCAALENDRSDVELSLNCRRVRNVADELGPEALVVQRAGPGVLNSQPHQNLFRLCELDLRLC